MRRLVFGLLVLAACGTAAAGQPPPPGLPDAANPDCLPARREGRPGARGEQARHHLQVRHRDHGHGTDLDEPEKLVFSHPGIKGEYVAPPPAAG